MAERPWKFESSRPHHLTIPRPRIGASPRRCAGASPTANRRHAMQPKRKLGFVDVPRAGRRQHDRLRRLPAAGEPRAARLELGLSAGWSRSPARSASPSCCTRLARGRAGQLRGPYAYPAAAFGPGAGFVVAWSYWISIWVANAALAIAAVSNLSIVWPGARARPASPALAAIGLLWLLTLVNCLGVRDGGRGQVVTTLLKLLPLAARSSSRSGCSAAAARRRRRATTPCRSSAAGDRRRGDPDPVRDARLRKRDGGGRPGRESGAQRPARDPDRRR